MQQFFLY